MKNRGLLITRSAVRARPEEPLQNLETQRFSPKNALEQKRTFDLKTVIFKVKRLTFVLRRRLTFCHRRAAKTLFCAAFIARQLPIWPQRGARFGKIQ